MGFLIYGFGVILGGRGAGFQEAGFGTGTPKYFGVFGVLGNRFAGLRQVL